MAFKNYTKTIAAGAPEGTDTQVRAATSTDVIIGLNVANTSSTTTATVAVKMAGIKLLDNAQIPVGGAIEVIQGKIVLESGDDIDVIPTGAGVDVVMSVLENA
jgi:hypothetical protein